jgi:hypothetical protein
LSVDLRAGAIVHTYIATIDPPKDKLGLIARIDQDRDSVHLFLIHTELPKFIQEQPKLIKGVTKIDKDEHSFLDYDSWLRFGEIHACQYSTLLRQIREKERCFLGYVSERLLKHLIGLIPKCPELSPNRQRAYCSALSSDPRLIQPHEKSI